MTVNQVQVFKFNSTELSPRRDDVATSLAVVPVVVLIPLLVLVQVLVLARYLCSVCCTDASTVLY
jgi:hypothetical protein